MRKNRLITTPDIVDALMSGQANAIWKIVKGDVDQSRVYGFLGRPGTLLYSPEPGYLNERQRVFLRNGDRAVKLVRLGPEPVIADVRYDDVHANREKYPDWRYCSPADVPMWACSNWMEIEDISLPVHPSALTEIDLQALGFREVDRGNVYEFPGIMIECGSMRDAWKYVFKFFFSQWRETKMSGELMRVAYKFDDDDDIIEPAGTNIRCVAMVPHIELYRLRPRKDMK